MQASRKESAVPVRRKAAATLVILAGFAIGAASAFEYDQWVEGFAVAFIGGPTVAVLVQTALGLIAAPLGEWADHAKEPPSRR